MAICLTTSDLSLIHRQAGLCALRLVRKLRLPWHEHEDVRQDLLVDLFSRLKHFDPTRGALGAFVGAVLSNGASMLMARIRRERRHYAGMSLDDPLPSGDGTIGDIIPEAAGYLASVGQPVDRQVIIDRTLDVGRALGALSQPDLIFCKHLLNQTPAELSQAGLGSRAGLYRQLADIRLELTARGLAVAA